MANQHKPITISTSVDLHDVEVEVEVDPEEILAALDQCDDPLTYFPSEIREKAEATFQYYRTLPHHEVPECVRQLIWYTIGRIL